MKNIIITQARYGSTRFPGKILEKINNKSLLQIHLERLKKTKGIDKIVVATTFEPEAKKIIEIAEKCDVFYFQGSTEDVLDRFYHTAKKFPADYIVRVTSDCPLIDGELINQVMDETIRQNVDYGSNIFTNRYPDGQDIEVFTFASLKAAWEDAELISEREHVTPYIRKNTDINGGELFKGYSLNSSKDYSMVRMTLDELSDYNMFVELIKELDTDKKWDEYADFILKKDLNKINFGINRNEGYIRSLSKDHEK